MKEGAKFSKQELLGADCFKGQRDILAALLVDGREYTLAEANKAITKFMKGKVKQ